MLVRSVGMCEKIVGPPGMQIACIWRYPVPLERMKDERSTVVKKGKSKLQRICNILIPIISQMSVRGSRHLHNATHGTTGMRSMG